jgi:hypothetical protein
MIEDFINATGKLNIQVIDPNGNVKQNQTVDNLVVTAGKVFIASRMAGTASAVMSYMAIGTGTTAAAVGDTALQTQSAIVALTSTTASSNTVVYVGTFPAGTPATLTAITEAGIFNASSAGTMLCHTIFSAVNKDTGDTMAITWTITLS